jgi:hypothetical protein
LNTLITYGGVEPKSFTRLSPMHDKLLAPTPQNTTKTPFLSLVSLNNNLQIHNGTKIKILSKLSKEQNKNNDKIKKIS